MTRKKRKVVKSPVAGAPDIPASPAKKSPAAEIGLPLLGALALVAAWLAALGGVSTEAVDWRDLFDLDTVRARLHYDELSLAGDAAYGWTLGPSPYYFPDFLALWGMFALGVDWRAGYYLYSLLQAALGACGWILVCDRLFGKSPARRAAVLILHAAPFLIMSWRGNDIYLLHMLMMWHMGAWVMIPWMLRLALWTLESRGRKNAADWRRFIPLTAALAAVMMSDMFLLPWFVAPAGVAALCLVRLRELSGRDCVGFLCALAAATALAPMLARLPGYGQSDLGLNLGVAAALSSAAAAAKDLTRTALAHPVDAMVWTAFAAIALWRAAAALSPTLEKRTPADWAPLKVSRTRAHLFCAIFIPAAAAAAVAALIVGGRVLPSFFEASYYGKIFRLIIPFFGFPLFVGWALLPWRAGKFGTSAAALAAAAVIALSVPRAALIDFAAMDPFASPFQQCLAQNARRLEWTGGIAPPHFAKPLEGNPQSGVQRTLPIGTFRRQGVGESFIVVDAFTANKNLINGDFQFVVANLHNNRVFGRPPRAGDAGCPAADSSACFDPKFPNYLMDAESARAAFGPPQEEITCAGIGLLHYDPPLHFDFSHLDDPHLAVVARW